MFGFISGIKTWSTDFTTSFDTSYTTSYDTSHVTTFSTSHVTSYTTTYTTSTTTSYTTTFDTSYTASAYSYGSWGPALYNTSPPGTYVYIVGSNSKTSGAQKRSYYGYSLQGSPYYYSYYGHFGNYEFEPTNIVESGSNSTWRIRRRTKSLYYFTAYTSTSRTTSYVTSYSTSHVTSYTTTYDTSRTTTYTTSNTTTRTTSNTTTRTTNFYSSI